MEPQLVRSETGAQPPTVTEPKSCPSARAEPGALLIGIVGPDGMVQTVPTRLEIDARFIEKASAVGPPEARFRFGGRCVEGQCRQWTGNSCGVIERVLTGMVEQDTKPVDTLPRCAIRGTCRWYAQRQETACRACVYVVTDQTEACTSA